jgi:hypothetical protein
MGLGDKSLDATVGYLNDWARKFRVKFNTPRFAIACRATPDKKAVRVWRIPDRDPIVRKPKTNLYALKKSA